MNNDNKKIIGILSICRKAGRLTLGFDTAKESLQNNKAKIILLSEDISPKTEKEIRFHAEKYKTAVFKTTISQEDFYYEIGKKVGVVTILDDGFANKITELINNNGGNYAYEYK